MCRECRSWLGGEMPLSPVRERCIDGTEPKAGGPSPFAMPSLLGAWDPPPSLDLHAVSSLAPAALHKARLSRRASALPYYMLALRVLTGPHRRMDTGHSTGGMKKLARPVARPLSAGRHWCNPT